MFSLCTLCYVRVQTCFGHSSSTCSQHISLSVPSGMIFPEQKATSYIQHLKINISPMIPITLGMYHARISHYVLRSITALMFFFFFRSGKIILHLLWQQIHLITYFLKAKIHNLIASWKTNRPIITDGTHISASSGLLLVLPKLQLTFQYWRMVI